MERPVNQKAWFMVLPVVLVVSFSAIVPLMTVVNYSVQVIMMGAGNWNGVEWYMQTLRSEDFQEALSLQVIFSSLVLLIEIPLGVGVALCMPRRGAMVSLCLVLMALPLLIPWPVVGRIWQIMGRSDIGLFGALMDFFWDFSYTGNTRDAWLTLMTMEVWHWTSLVVLLSYAGLQSIPDAFYQAARIDGASRWAIFRNIELPKLKGVLMIAVLLRFMDSFKIYAEVENLTGGGNNTTFLSQKLSILSVEQRALGEAASYSIIYFLIILLLSYVFYVGVLNVGKEQE